MPKMEGEAYQESNMQKDLPLCKHRIHIEFKDVSYSVIKGRGKNKATQNILKNIHGQFHPGRLTAILGPSGAGKSTLLNVLSGFKTSGVKGSILLNGHERSIPNFRKLCSYITQDFAILPQLTTRETILIAADLKLGNDISTLTKNSMVDEILDLLELYKCKDKQIGMLSGGEIKRLSVGVELITNPPVMFFDEPTSGLDSSSSYQMISHLKSLARAERTIVCSIHQPSSEILEMFDDIFILSEGQCLYNGPLSDMTNLFNEEGFICPKYYNRADFAIEVACKERGESIHKLITRSREEFIKSSHRNRSAKTGSVSQIPGVHGNETSSDKHVIEIPSEKQDNMVPEYSTSSFSQFIVLSRRSLLCTYRDFYLTQIRFLVHIVIGFLLGVLCYDVGNDASKISSNVASIYFVTFFLFMLSPPIVALTFPLEASVFLREHKNNWYSLKSYYFSKFIADLPLQILCPTALLIGYYYLTDQPFDNMRFQKYWFLCILWTLTSQVMGSVAGAAFTPQLGFFILFSITMPFAMFSGFLIRFYDIPIYLQWITKISFYRYAFEGLMVTIYGSNRENLYCSEMYCHFRSPAKVLEEFDMTDSKYEVCILAVALWIIIFQIMFFCVLKWRVFKSR